MIKDQTTSYVQVKTPATAQSSSHRNWYVQIDGLRFIAVTAVLLEHFATYIGGPLQMGFFGVDLFFVISGFLISEGLLNEKTKGTPAHSIRKFYLKRFLRIFPIYYLLLIVALIFFEPFKQIAVWAFTYTVNLYPRFTGNQVVSPFGHLWSLSVEEQFYIFWPFVILLANRKFLLPVLGVLFFTSLVYYVAENDNFSLLGRGYSLCLGTILAYIKKNRADFYKQDALKKFGVVFLFAAVIFFVHNGVGISLLSFGLVYLGSNNAFRGWFQKFLENRKVLYVGKVSYGVYLYHLPIALLLGTYFFDPVWNNIDFSFFPQLKGHPWLIKLPLYSLVSIGVAHLSYISIERPLLKLKSRIK
jgi:peptidoglycan/LPS O-acetylase OafA/YrhL